MEGWTIQLVGGPADGAVFILHEVEPPWQWNVPGPRRAATVWSDESALPVSEFPEIIGYRRTRRMNDNGHILYEYPKD